MPTVARAAVSGQSPALIDVLDRISPVGEKADYVYITTKPNNQQGKLCLANVTAYNGSDMISSGISNTTGIVTLVDVPYGDIIFVAYAGLDHSQVIGNQTVLISMEGQSFSLICDQNYGEATVSWTLITTISLSLATVPSLLSLFSIRMLARKAKGLGVGTSQRKLASPVSEKDKI